ncbi:MAG TPA: hypothetical protein VE843_07050, partial [Ktedonobacteraceae bacterium]|nr:hypothetical protein [Ktedonobacteraceae bacterium]
KAGIVILRGAQDLGPCYVSILERRWNNIVILSTAKDLGPWRVRFFADAQNDNTLPISVVNVHHRPCTSVVPHTS